MLYTQTIGKSMPNGYAGSYSRQPDSVIDTHALSSAHGTPNVRFGMGVVVSGNDGEVTLPASGATADHFVGVAVREVKSALDFLNQNEGVYRPGEPVAVIKRGCVNVVCQKGTPKAGGAVHMRIAENEAYPNAAAGGFEAEADGENTVQLTNCQWKGRADANGIAELRILTIINA